MKQRATTIMIGSLLFVPTLQSSNAADEPSVMPYAQRLEIAHNMIDGMRELLGKSPNDVEQRATMLTQMASVDPVWAADFIVRHPLPPEGPLYDHNATLEILSRASELSEKHLFALIESAPHLRETYAFVALKSIPPEEQELRQRIVTTGLTRTPNVMITPRSFEHRIELAKASSDPADLKQVREEIAEYYRSGQAMETRKQLEEQLRSTPLPRGVRRENQAAQLVYYDVLLERFAPEEMKSQFSAKGEQRTNASLAQVLQQELPVETRRTIFRELGDVDFGEYAHEKISVVTSLGKAGLVDPELALERVQAAPEAVIRLWGQLLIAPSLARSDKRKAKRLIRDSYRELSELQPDTKNLVYYNYGPALVGARGLSVVEAVAPELLDRCVSDVLTVAKRFRSGQNAQPNQHFTTLAMVWRYAPDKVNPIFARDSLDVPLGHAEGFFRALAVITPEALWNEYSTMPEAGDNGVDYRVYVRNALIPALTQKNSEDFLSAVLSFQGLEIPADILEPK